jgi:hypothetical protein
VLDALHVRVDAPAMLAESARGGRQAVSWVTRNLARKSARWQRFCRVWEAQVSVAIATYAEDTGQWQLRSWPPWMCAFGGAVSARRTSAPALAASQQELPDHMAPGDDRDDDDHPEHRTRLCAGRAGEVAGGPQG